MDRAVPGLCPRRHGGRNGLGTLILVPMAENLIESHGWRGAYLRLAIAVAIIVNTCALVVVGRRSRRLHRPSHG